MLTGFMIRFFSFVSILTLFAQASSAVILAIPDEKDWDEPSRSQLFKMLEDHSIFLNKLDSEKARSYVESNLTEQEFIEQEISKQFPNKKVQIADVPATLVDMGALNEEFFMLYPRTDNNLQEWLGPIEWPEEQKVNFYFNVSKLVLSAVQNEGSYERALNALFSNIAPLHKGKFSFQHMKRDLDSQNSRVREALRLETEALQEDSFVWFRGIKGVDIKNYGMALDCPISQKSLKNFSSLTQKECFESMRSLSFGASLLAGITGDPKACAYSIAKTTSTKLYSLTLPKKSLLSEEWKGLWYKPNGHPALQALERGEFFHPRLNGGVVEGYPLFHFDDTLNYKDFTRLTSRLLLENSSLIVFEDSVVTPDSHLEEKAKFREVHQRLYDFFAAN